MVPAVAGSIPKRASPTSVRPAPISPAKPSTSPRCTSKLTSWNAPSRASPRTEMIRSPCGSSGRGIISPISRPTISAIAPCGVASARGLVEIRRPSRNTVTLSAISKTSSRRWLTNRIATPLSRRSRTSLNSMAASWADSDAVGSSMISTRTFNEIALAISTDCCAASVRPRAGLRTSSTMPNVRRMSSASRNIRRQFVKAPRSWCPMNMFSATLRSGKSSGS